jgi:hypothetical protein
VTGGTPTHRQGLDPDETGEAEAGKPAEEPLPKDELILRWVNSGSECFWTVSPARVSHTDVRGRHTAAGLKSERDERPREEEIRCDLEDKHSDVVRVPKWSPVGVPHNKQDRESGVDEMDHKDAEEEDHHNESDSDERDCTGGEVNEHSGDSRAHQIADGVVEGGAGEGDRVSLGHHELRNAIREDDRDVEEWTDESECEEGFNNTDSLP